jgi:hypothetical protein
MMQVSKQCFTWLLCLGSYFAVAQSPFWQRTYNQPVNDFPNATIAFDGSGFMMTGYYYTQPNSSAIEGFFFKVNRQGEPVWEHRDSFLYGQVVPTRDSGYLILGSSVSNHAHHSIHKINKLGVEQWRKNYPNPYEFILLFPRRATRTTFRHRADCDSIISNNLLYRGFCHSVRNLVSRFLSFR